MLGVLAAVVVVGAGAWLLLRDDGDDDGDGGTDAAAQDGAEDGGAAEEPGDSTDSTDGGSDDDGFSPALPDPEAPPPGASPDQIRELLVDQFTASGMSESQATCVVDGLFDEFGEDLTAIEQLTEEQIESLTELTLLCIQSG